MIDDDTTVWLGEECIADAWGDTLAAIVSDGFGREWQKWMDGRKHLGMPSTAELRALHEQLKAKRAAQ